MIIIIVESSALPMLSNVTFENDGKSDDDDDDDDHHDDDDEEDPDDDCDDNYHRSIPCITICLTLLLKCI